MVKANGRPYLKPLRDGYWDFMLSSKANPVLLMLELIWTKISLEFDVGMPWGDDFEMEGLNEFLRAKAIIKEEQGGWMFKYDELSKDTLESRTSSIEWEPVEVTSSVYAIFHQLTQSDVYTKEPDFIAFAEKGAGSVSEFIDQITSTNFAAYDGESLSLNSENLIAAVLSDGRFVLAENNSGRFDAWLKRNYLKI